MPQRSIDERFWSKVDRNGPIPSHRPDLGPCWVWTATRFNNGYGQFRLPTTHVGAHRWIYERIVGQIPTDYHIDHLCRNKACCNPSHLEAVTLQENLRRHHAFTTECPRGHPYDDANTRMYRGKRHCRACDRLRPRRADRRPRLTERRFK